MSASSRTYWLTEPCRIRREDGSIRIERADATPVRIPITDIRDTVAFDHVDINTAAISVLGRHGVIIHVLDHYGNYVGAITPAEENSSAHVIRSQVKLTDLPETKISVGRALVTAAAHNIRWCLETDLLDEPLKRLTEQLAECASPEQLMGAEGNFRRTAWGVLDTMLPPWLRLEGRTRRPPTNAGNAFISYMNAITYARGPDRAALHPAASSARFPARRYRSPT